MTAVVFAIGWLVAGLAVALLLGRMFKLAHGELRATRQRRRRSTVRQWLRWLGTAWGLR